MPPPAFGKQPMKSGSLKSGWTLVEILAVIAIISILTIELVGNALEQFRDFGYEYKDDYYNGLVFPLDCNGFGIITGTFPYPNIPDTLHNALYSSNSLDPPIITISGGAHDPTFSSSEVLYFILSQVPDCRATLDKIDKSLLTNKGADGNPLTISIGTLPAMPFTRIIDPWGTTLRYDYYPDYADYTGTTDPYKVYRDSAKRTFPVITSAGPDKQFGTADDISSREPK
jgi:prepilin-type N-terminal cleavage/methylation domain-containing protein